MRKVKGGRYPPQTQKDICTGIQYYFNNTLKWSVSLFSDKEFSKSRKSLDAHMKISAKEGLVRPKKKAVAIPEQEENELWLNGSFGWSYPKQLQDTLLYYFGLHFSLRAAQEHRDLQYGENSQLTLKCDSDGTEYIEYVERVSKNKRFGLKSARMEPKVTSLYARKDKTKCPVECYKKFVAHRPEANGGPNCSAFYLSVIQNPTSEKWYKPVPLGVHSIQRVVRDLFKNSSIDGFVSNSSLRRTAQNRLLQRSVPQMIIHKKTGRISDTADSAYVESKIFEKDMSKVLYGEPSTSNISNFDSHNSSDFMISNSSLPPPSTGNPVPVYFSNCQNCNVTVNYNFNQSS